MRQFLRSIEFEYSEQSRQFFREAFCGLLGILLILSPYVGYGQDIVGPDNPLPGKVVVSCRFRWWYDKVGSGLLAG